MGSFSPTDHCLRLISVLVCKCRVTYIRERKTPEMYINQRKTRYLHVYVPGTLTHFCNETSLVHVGVGEKDERGKGRKGERERERKREREREMER